MTIPFTMTGRVEDCIQLTYRTPTESVRQLLPEGLELVTRGPWAFWNVMACRVHKLRPAGVPALCGVSYHHIAYRLRVQAMNERAEVVQGLYFLRSEVDARIVAALANQLTDLRLNPATIAHTTSDCGLAYHAQAERGSALTLNAAHAPAALAKDSCFPTTEDARRFCRYTPNALAVTDHAGRRLLRITRVQRDEHAWSETPLAVHEAELGYLESIGQYQHMQLEWACRLGAMDYRWQVGETVGLLKQPVGLAVTQAAG